MPQASERWFATPMIRPRLPRMRPEVSGIPLTLSELNDPKSPAATYGIGPPDRASARLGLIRASMGP